MAITVSVLDGVSNSHQTTAEEVNNFGTDFVDEGVVGATTNTSGVSPATGAFAVNEQSPAAMTLDVTAGTAYVDATPTGQGAQTLRVKSSTTEEVTIAANSSGSTKYDWIYIKIDPDTADDPNVSATDVATLVTSRSTSASSDDGTPPTYGYPIAVVTVANGAASIGNASITDKRTETGVLPYDEAVTTTKIADGAVTAAKVDFGGSGAGIWWEEIGRTTLASAGDAITVSSIPARKYLKIEIILIATGGTLNTALTFNSDSGTNYATTKDDSGAADTDVSQANIGLEAGTVASGGALYATIETMNVAAARKNMFYVATNDGAATAATAPVVTIGAGKWVNTSDQITTVSIANIGTGDFAIGSEIVVLGHD